MSPEQSRRRLPPRSRFVDSQACWRGTEEGRLVVQYCPETGRFQHFPRPISLYTGKRSLEWREVSGRGSIYAVTVLRTPSLGAAKIGARVRLNWDEIAEGVRYPAFELER